MPFLNVKFLDVISVSNINPCCFHKMNTRRNIGQRRGGAAVGGNQAPQVPVKGVATPVKPVRLTYVEVRASMAQMA